MRFGKTTGEIPVKRGDFQGDLGFFRGLGIGNLENFPTLICFFFFFFFFFGGGGLPSVKIDAGDCNHRIKN